MGRETGGYRLRFLVVRAGKFVRKPLFKANSKVDRAGEKRVLCANATSSPSFGSPRRFTYSIFGDGRSICHIPVARWRAPDKTIALLLCVSKTLISVFDKAIL